MGYFPYIACPSNWIKMKKHFLISTSIVCLFFIASEWGCSPYNNPKEKDAEEEEEEYSKMLPHEWMYAQRAYPHNKINREVQVEAMRIVSDAKTNPELRLNGEWESAGPTNIGGRITDIALHPTNQDIIYLGTTAGGVFKSIDKGSTWEAIFEEEGAMSIGDIAIAPSAPNTLYVGSGEANGESASGAFFGDGLYKSTDAGASWQFIGLENTQHIGRIVVDPQNADRVYVAAAGTLYGKNQDRGLYRTINGGATWDQVLFVSDSTSCIDVVVNPQNADDVYAATWERIRLPWGRRYGGLTSRIYKSTDGGNNWVKLSNGLPPDNPETGRIGLAISPSNPSILFAVYTTHAVFNTFNGIYKSVNSGNTWERVDDNLNNNIFRTYGWFFGNLRVHPTNSNDVSLLAISLYRSLDGGNVWQNATLGMHVDFHAVEFHPQNPDFLVAGNDGGVYISQNGGFVWSKPTGIPNNLFYACKIDPVQPERIFGGTQDQGVLRTTSGGIDDFEEVLGGDGFRVLVDPSDNNIVYAENSFGELYRSEQGGQSFSCIFYCSQIGFEDVRTNWNTPIVLHPNVPSTIFYGAQQLYKSTDRGDNFFAISPDLTDGLHPSGSLSYGTISAIGVSKTNENYIYVGTDDGNVQVTKDGGGFWKNISAGVPDRYVTAVAVDPIDPTIAYVSLSGYREVDYQPHILRTTDSGNQWTDISANLPEIPINDIIVHPDFPKVLFIANDLGVWFSNSSGQQWEIVGTNFPPTVVNDLDLHAEEQVLLAATYGRSMLKFDISQLDLVPTDEERKIQQSFQVYPNPAAEYTILKIDFPTPANGEIQLFDLKGQLLKVIDNQYFTKGVNEVNIDLNGLPNGQYLIRVETNKGTFKGRVVKGR